MFNFFWLFKKVEIFSPYFWEFLERNFSFQLHCKTKSFREKKAEFELTENLKFVEETVIFAFKSFKK